MGIVHNISQVSKNRGVYLHYALSFGPKNTLLGLAQSAPFRQYSSPGVERNLSLSLSFLKVRQFKLLTVTIVYEYVI
jgi:hypothetical protein